MSNKNLLNESTIRKFMKLANMEPLAEEFVSTHLQTEDEEVELEEANDEEIEEGKHEKEEDEEKKVEEVTDETIDEMGGDYMGKDDDEPMDDLGGEEPMDDLGGEEEMGGDAEVSLDEEEVAALKAALEAAQSVMDKLAGGLGGDEEEAPMDEPMDDMGEPEMDDPAGRDVDVPMMEEDELEEEEDLGIDLVDENELVAEVLKKVVKKLSYIKRG